MPVNMHEKVEVLDKVIWSKETWISDHGSKRPEHEVDIQRGLIRVLSDIRSDYKRSIERSEAKDGAA